MIVLSGFLMSLPPEAPASALYCDRLYSIGSFHMYAFLDSISCGFVPSSFVLFAFGTTAPVFLFSMTYAFVTRPANTHFRHPMPF